MNKKSLGVRLDYYKGILNDDELIIYKNKLKEFGIELIERDKSHRVVAFMDEFTNKVSLLISNPLFQAYILGLLTNGGYDLLKSTIIWMWNSLPGKKLTKIQPSGITEEEATFGLHMRVDFNTDIDFRLTGDAPDELKSKCIDKAFEIIKDIPRGKDHHPINWFANYSWERYEWEIINVIEEINKRLTNKEKENDNHKIN